MITDNIFFLYLLFYGTLRGYTFTTIGYYRRCCKNKLMANYVENITAKISKTENMFIPIHIVKKRYISKCTKISRRDKLKSYPWYCLKRRWSPYFLYTLTVMAVPVTKIIPLLIFLFNQSYHISQHQDIHLSYFLHHDPYQCHNDLCFTITFLGTKTRSNGYGIMKWDLIQQSRKKWKESMSLSGKSIARSRVHPAS